MNSIYFDNAATSLKKPPQVAERMLSALMTAGNAGRGAHTSTLSASRIIYETRRQLAELFHAESASRIAFTQNATEALNTAIYGTISPGDHVITTAAEHNSVLRPLHDLEDQGLALTVIPCDKKGRYSYQALEAAITPKTKAIVCCHGSNLTGNLYDIEAIGRIARRHNLLFIVDAAQTAGIMDIDVQSMNIDILCFTGHKSLLGPQGTGGIYVREGVRVRPLKQGGSGIKTFERLHPTDMPTALEAGTLNCHGIAGLLGALSYLQETGLQTIREKEQELLWYLYEEMKKIPEITLYGDFEDRNKARCPIISFNMTDPETGEVIDSGSIGDVLLTDYGISTRTGGHCAPLMHQALGTVKTGAIRISLSHFNTMEEADALITALSELTEETCEN